MSGQFVRYAANGFWLVLPALLIDLAFTGRLPAMFQPESFWRDIPPVLAAAENILRFAVIATTLLLPLPLGRMAGKAPAIALYLAGLVAYGLAWLALIARPESLWSQSVPGLAAPAYTPLLWLAGIGLVADGDFTTRWPWLRWAYVGLAFAFTALHLAHSLLVFLR